MLYYKGFHAIQTYRLAHWLWGKGRRDFALYLQSRSSAVFQCDIHPAAKIGRGIFLDHATGLVVGETAVIEDDVSILHDVTLGGTGKEREDRHPKIRYGVMIGAGAKILGNIEVGHCARIAAGIGGDQAGAEQRHGRRRAGQGDRRRRLPRARAHHGSDVSKRSVGAALASMKPRAMRDQTPGDTRWTFRKLENSTLILKKLFGNARIRVVPRPKKDDSAEVYIGEEFIGVLFVDDEDDERSYNFQMAILATDLE